MSTKSTIWCSSDDETPRVHLFEEVLEENIYLEIKGCGFQVRVRVPPEFVQAITESEACTHFAEHGTTVPER